MNIPRPIASALLVLPWLLAATGVAWLVVLRFPPSGAVTFDVPFDGKSAWIDPFLPAERVTSPGNQEGDWSGQRILGDPVYGSIRIPGTYDNVNVAVEFRTTRQPLLELGIQQVGDADAYAYTPIWFEPLQDPSWRPVQSGEHSGFVREGTADSILSSTSADYLLAWHASATMPLLSDAAGVIKKTDVSLRGSQDFWVIPASGTVAFAFEFQDANRTRGNDAIILKVTRGDEEVRTDAIGVGGSRDTTMGRVFSKAIRIDGAKPGVYRVQVIADDNVFIRSITTPCVHWVVGPRLVFGDLVGYATSTPPAIAWSNSRHLVLETFHNEGLQRITFGSSGATLSKTHDQMRLDRIDPGAAPQTLVAPNGDVRIIGDGWFAFSRDAFFSPEPRRVTDQTNLDREGIDGVLAPYVRPESLGDGWYRATINLALDPSLDHVRLALSAPGIVSRSGSVDIRRVTLTYTRPPLSWKEWFRVVRQELVNAWHRIT